MSYRIRIPEISRSARPLCAKYSRTPVLCQWLAFSMTVVVKADFKLAVAANGNLNHVGSRVVAKSQLVARLADSNVNIVIHRYTLLRSYS